MDAFKGIDPKEWLVDASLTEAGKKVREEYTSYCEYISSLGLLSYQQARIKYLNQRVNSFVLPEGYALPPHTINVCVNNICNLKCRYCDFGQQNDETFYHKYNVVDSSKKVELSLDTCKNIVDQVKWFKPIIRASFREPMIYKDILPFIEYTKSQGLPFWLLTNGFNLRYFAKDLVELDTDSIRVSLDGPEAVHDEIRGVNGSYRKMIEGVKCLIEEKKKQNNSKMQIGFYFTLNDLNYNRLAETLDALEEEGILKEVFFNFQWLLYTTKKMADQHNEKDAEICGGYIDESTVQNVDISGIKYDICAQQASDIANKYSATKGYRIHFRPSFDEKAMEKYLNSDDFPIEDPKCRVPWYNFNINPAGDVKSFHHCLLPVAGNIYETLSLMDIWNGVSFRTQRKGLLEHGAYRGCARCWGIYNLLDDKRRKNEK